MSILFIALEFFMLDVNKKTRGATFVQARKKHVVLDSLASLVNAHAAFFTQGHQLLTQVEPYMKGLAGELQAMQESAARLEKQLEKRHTYVTQGQGLWIPHLIQCGSGSCIFS